MSGPGPEASGPPVPVRLSPDGASVIILDQTALPEREEERELRTVEDVEEAIRMLRVRGAPLIGITAALGVAALARRAARGGTAGGEDADARAGDERTEVRTARDDLVGGEDADSGSGTFQLKRVRLWCERLARARPTAVNLAWAMGRTEAVAERALTAGDIDPSVLAGLLEAEARRIHDDDRAMCQRIGEHALALLGEPADDLVVLTHCNAGALATGGIGTALAPIYLAHGAGRRVRVFADETRPLLQGSRLTAWELQRAGVDVTVLPDGTAGALLAERPPDAVLVGADRIAANGDVANKIGTYGLAVLARHHEVPFYVLAPTTTVDLASARGAAIPIEHRDPDEVRYGFGRLTAPRDAAVWSPAFDITPAALVTAIVTERGIHRPPYPPALREAVEAAAADRRRGGRP